MDLGFATACALNPRVQPGPAHSSRPLPGLHGPSVPAGRVQPEILSGLSPKHLCAISTNCCAMTRPRVSMRSSSEFDPTLDSRRASAEDPAAGTGGGRGRCIPSVAVLGLGAASQASVAAERYRSPRGETPHEVGTATKRSNPSLGDHLKTGPEAFSETGFSARRSCRQLFSPATNPELSLPEGDTPPKGTREQEFSGGFRPRTLYTIYIVVVLGVYPRKPGPRGEPLIHPTSIDLEDAAPGCSEPGTSRPSEPPGNPGAAGPRPCRRCQVAA